MKKTSLIFIIFLSTISVLVTTSKSFSDNLSYNDLYNVYLAPLSQKGLLGDVKNWDDNKVRSLLQEGSFWIRVELFKQLGQHIGLPDENGELEVDDKIIGLFYEMLKIQPGDNSKGELLFYTMDLLPAYQFVTQARSARDSFEEIVTKRLRPLYSRLSSIISKLLKYDEAYEKPKSFRRLWDEFLINNQLTFFWGLLLTVEEKFAFINASNKARDIEEGRYVPLLPSKEHLFQTSDFPGDWSTPENAQKLLDKIKVAQQVSIAMDTETRKSTEESLQGLVDKINKRYNSEANLRIATTRLEGRSVEEQLAELPIHFVKVIRVLPANQREDLTTEDFRKKIENIGVYATLANEIATAEATGTINKVIPGKLTLAEAEDKADQLARLGIVVEYGYEKGSTHQKMYRLPRGTLHETRQNALQTDELEAFNNARTANKTYGTSTNYDVLILPEEGDNSLPQDFSNPTDAKILLDQIVVALNILDFAHGNVVSTEKAGINNAREVLKALNNKIKGEHNDLVGDSVDDQLAARINNTTPGDSNNPGGTGDDGPSDAEATIPADNNPRTGSAVTLSEEIKTLQADLKSLQKNDPKFTLILGDMTFNDAYMTDLASQDTSFMGTNKRLNLFRKLGEGIGMLSEEGQLDVKNLEEMQAIIARVSELEPEIVQKAFLIINTTFNLDSFKLLRADSSASITHDIAIKAYTDLRLREDRIIEIFEGQVYTDLKIALQNWWNEFMEGGKSRLKEFYAEQRLTEAEVNLFIEAADLGVTLRNKIDVTESEMIIADLLTPEYVQQNMPREFKTPDQAQELINKVGVANYLKIEKDWGQEKEHNLFALFNRIYESYPDLVYLPLEDQANNAAASREELVTLKPVDSAAAQQAFIDALNKKGFSYADATEKFMAAMKEKKAMENVVEDTAIAPLLKSYVQRYAETAKLENGLAPLIEKMKTDETRIESLGMSVKDYYGSRALSWVTAGIPVSEANKTPTVPKAAQRCVDKISETSIKKADGTALKDVQGNEIKLGEKIFDQPQDYYAMTAVLRAEKNPENPNDVRQKIYCGAIFQRERE